jgi:hypothetical protein
MLAGCGRSGTTWLAEIIAARLSGRIMFEPFHAHRVERLKELQYFHYLRPTDTNALLAEYSEDVFSGRIRHIWVDKVVDRLLPRYRIVKDIRANLFLKWLHLRFPQVPLVFMLRHPCAVVLSRLQLNWATDSDIEPLLAQPRLIEDHLGEFMEVIRRARTIEEKHAVIWCVSNLVPLRQFAADVLPVVFYEDLCMNPGEAVPAVFRSIGQMSESYDCRNIAKPSSTVRGTRALVQGSDAVRRWTARLAPDQIRNILNIVDAFGLSALYGDSVTPLPPRNLASGLTSMGELG